MGSGHSHDHDHAPAPPRVRRILVAAVVPFVILTVIAVYALCGFANFGSIGIQIGGLATLMPSRRGDLARVGLRAMIAGSLASFQTAAVAAMVL